MGCGYMRYRYRDSASRSLLLKKSRDIWRQTRIYNSCLEYRYPVQSKSGFRFIVKFEIRTQSKVRVRDPNTVWDSDPRPWNPIWIRAQNRIRIQILFFSTLRIRLRAHSSTAIICTFVYEQNVKQGFIDIIKRSAYPQTFDCWGLYHQWCRSKPENHVERHARWPGSAGTLKDHHHHQPYSILNTLKKQHVLYQPFMALYSHLCWCSVKQPYGAI